MQNHDPAGRAAAFAFLFVFRPLFFSLHIYYNRFFYKVNTKIRIEFLLRPLSREAKKHYSTVAAGCKPHFLPFFGTSGYMNAPRPERFFGTKVQALVFRRNGAFGAPGQRDMTRRNDAFGADVKSHGFSEKTEKPRRGQSRDGANTNAGDERNRLSDPRGSKADRGRPAAGSRGGGAPR